MTAQPTAGASTHRRMSDVAVSKSALSVASYAATNVSRPSSAADDAWPRPTSVAQARATQTRRAQREDLAGLASEHAGAQGLLFAMAFERELDEPIQQARVRQPARLP